MRGRTIALAAAVLASCAAALADDTAAHVTVQEGGAINVGQAFSAAVAPYVNAAVNALIVVIIGWVAAAIKKRTGIEIDEKQRENLTRALKNQAGSLIADGAVKLQGITVNVHNDALARAVNDLMASIPDVVAHLGITPDYVAKRIVDTIPQTEAGAKMVADAHAEMHAGL